MMLDINRIGSMARLVVKDGFRRKAMIGLIFFALTAQIGALYFSSFIPRDIGRAANDYLFFVLWLVGFIFILSHCVYVTAWDGTRGVIHTYLARPLSRYEYVLGLFVGFTILLLILNLFLACTGYAVLLFIKSSLKQVYFPDLSLLYYCMTAGGLLLIELCLLAVVMLFSCVVRGHVPVLLMSLSYYFICSGLPVVRSSLGTYDDKIPRYVPVLLKWMTAVFPDFSRLDFKSQVVTASFAVAGVDIFALFVAALIYIVLILFSAAYIYQKRDLQ